MSAAFTALVAILFVFLVVMCTFLGLITTHLKDISDCLNDLRRYAREQMRSPL